MGKAARHHLPRRLQGPARPEDRSQETASAGRVDRALRVTIPLAEKGRGIYFQAVARVWEENDSSIMQPKQEELAGVQVQFGGSKTWFRHRPLVVSLSNNAPAVSTLGACPKTG